MRALKMWRRSWLSREVLLFTAFSFAASIYAGTLWLGLGEAGIFGACTAILGLCGVSASARLYLVPGRPAWNSPFTIAEFLCTAAVFGASGAMILTHGAPGTTTPFLCAASATLLIAGAKTVRCAYSSIHELRGTWQLLTTVFQTHFFFRCLMLVAGILLLAVMDETWGRLSIAAVTLAGEFLSRYLFFVTVVPTNMATGYLAQEAG